MERKLKMSKKHKKDYSDFSNVKDRHNNLVPEELPEGPYGSPINMDEPIKTKSTPWEKGQRRKSAYVYPVKDLDEDLPSQAPGSHRIHDETGDVPPEEEQ